MRVLQVISVENISPHPHCVISVDLTPLRTETGQRKQPGTREAESLLINVSGRLWIIQREPEQKSDPTADGSGSTVRIGDPPFLPIKPGNIPCFQVSNITPLLLSSCVEMLWVHPSLSPSKEKPQLNEALWMFCGAHGMKVRLESFHFDFVLII